MPLPTSRRENRRFCGMSAQNAALDFGIEQLGSCLPTCIAILYTAEHFHPAYYIYICPALTLIAAVVTIVAYCVRMYALWMYAVALALNGFNFLFWLIALAGVIASWITSTGLDTKKEIPFGSVTVFYIAMIIVILIEILLSILFQLSLWFAFSDIKDEKDEAQLYKD
ncbi:hypothetical protein DdX_13431 [Ditylenchus destructor]|uniref:Uncharacterized protein n=1 Tax=Ditylenchus destructor TaxID=166010 RepID=A0AAD4MT01_9BILA|nr:hypothetical protein DdX_13431 [Ditylenchus destructor]